MSEIEKLAKKIRERDNPKLFGPQIGKVVEKKPPKISILNGEVILTDEIAYIAKAIEGETYYDKKEKKNKHGIGKEKGTKVLCIPMNGEQSWIIIDEVVV